MRLNMTKLLLEMARAHMIDKELCAKAGIAKITFAQIKAGKNKPKPATIGKIATALNVPVEQLID